MYILVLFSKSLIIKNVNCVFLRLKVLYRIVLLQILVFLSKEKTGMREGMLGAGFLSSGLFIRFIQYLSPEWNADGF